MNNLSRRQLVQSGLAVSAAAGLALPASAQGRLTAGEVVQRIMKNQGVPWNATGFRDTFKIGSPDMVVTGISTSFGGNLSVLQSSLKAGLNMLITHEPTFWSDGDVVGRVQDDPLYRYKLDWANKNNLIVWRNHDNVHAMRPSPIGVGLAQAMGWTGLNVDAANAGVYTIPPTTLNGLAKYVMQRLKLRNVRVIGDPNLPVTKATVGRGVALPGNADVRIASDVREWDAFEYARDATYAGQKKGLIVVSHEAHEDTGMSAFADFLRPLVPEAPVKYISTECVFWSV